MRSIGLLLMNTDFKETAIGHQVMAAPSTERTAPVM